MGLNLIHQFDPRPDTIPYCFFARISSLGFTFELSGSPAFFIAILKAILKYPL
jgi:hypothetical protein